MVSNDDQIETPRRIVSLLASITEILGALDVSEDIVGVTHCCDYPPAALDGAVSVTTSDIRPHALSQEEIHRRVTAGLRRGDSLYALDEEALVRLQPTHIFTQSLCDICAVHAPLVRETCARIFPGDNVEDKGGPYKIISLEPQSLSDVWETIRVASCVLGVQEKGEVLIISYLEDLQYIRNSVERHVRQRNDAKKPKVAFLEWHEPFVAGGHWIADMIDIAGGNYTLNETGKPSFCISDEDLLEYDPDIILIGPCGFDTDRAVRDTLPLLNHESRPVWKKLRAVQTEKVFALDGNCYYARPGPRLVQGTGLLARCIYPEIDIPERLAPSHGMRRIQLDMYSPAKNCDPLTKN